MKKIVFTLFVLVSNFMFSQSIATTDDGRKVLLKTDNTWSYVDGSESKEDGCNLGEDFKQSKINKGLLKFVMVDTDSNADEIKFIRSRRSVGGGNWTLCVKGRKISYKRVGSVYMRAGDNPF